MSRVWLGFLVVVLMSSAVSAAPSRKNLQPNVEEMANLFEGDIVLSEDQERAINVASVARVALSGIVGEKYRWDEKTVHYEISNDFGFEEKEIIENAMEEIADQTCVKFEERDGDDDFITIEDGNGCSSKVGKRGGEQTVTLSRNGCLKHGVVIHELVHALGFWHEQSRTDRDDFVDIIWKNIKPDKYNNFKKYIRAEIYDYQVPYDYNSVMHYRADAFKRDDIDDDTIVPKDPNAEIGQREGLSVLDARKINLMYCPEWVVNGTLKKPEEPESGDGGDGDDGDDEDEEEEDEDEEEEDRRRDGTEGQLEETTLFARLELETTTNVPEDSSKSNELLQYRLELFPQDDMKRNMTTIVVNDTLTNVMQDVTK